MSKQDRQGVRKASDIEQKYDLSLLKDIPKNESKQKEEVSRLNQLFSQYTVQVNERLQKLENMMLSVGSIYITLNTEHPAITFGGEWELIVEGQILMGLETESELPEVFQGNDKCFIWKRIA